MHENKEVCNTMATFLIPNEPYNCINIIHKEIPINHTPYTLY